MTFARRSKPASNATGRKKFYGAQLKVFTHYGSDEKNTPRQIRMLIKTGGGDPATGAPEGIHWHMNISQQDQVISRRTSKRQDIPYVHVKDMQGQGDRIHCERRER